MAKSDGSAFVLGFLLGAAAGAVAALITAPRSGQETMEQIRERGTQLKLKAEEFGQQTVHWAEEELERTQDSARSYMADLDTTLQETLEQVEDELKETEDQLQQAIDDAQDAADDYLSSQPS